MHKAKLAARLGCHRTRFLRTDVLRADHSPLYKAGCRNSRACVSRILMWIGRLAHSRSKSS